ncbi:MAG TPA: hypothetical protein VNU44_00540, partial [Bryobacteraceae bacterium]|nr:hypothetical protein [Bryobacteraceae bacterium]
MLDRQLQRLDHCLMQFCGARSAQPGCVGQGMNSRLEQYLVDINISESGNKRLIQQQRFHPRLASAQR